MKPFSYFMTPHVDSCFHKIIKILVGLSTLCEVVKAVMKYLFVWKWQYLHKGNCEYITWDFGETKSTDGQHCLLNPHFRKEYLRVFDNKTDASTSGRYKLWMSA